MSCLEHEVGELLGALTKMCPTEGAHAESEWPCCGYCYAALYHVSKNGRANYNHPDIKHEDDCPWDKARKYCEAMVANHGNHNVS